MEGSTKETLSTSIRRWIKLRFFEGEKIKKIYDRFSALHICDLIKSAVLSAFEIRKEASATVEAALVVPLFLFGYLAIMQLLWLVGVQINVNEALYDTGMFMAKSANELSDKGVASKSSMGVYFYGKLNREYIDDVGVVGDSMGIVTVASEVDESMENILIRADYVAKNPYDMVGFSLHKYTQTLYVRGWIGVERLGRGADVPKDWLVYVTDYGEVYHTYRDCAYLNPSVRPVAAKDTGSLRNLNGGRYYACGKCYSNTGIVYVTDYGEVYHSNRNCSGIKRGIMVMEKADIGNLPLCSKCGKRG